jgi:hypothetical protein
VEVTLRRSQHEPEYPYWPCSCRRGYCPCGCFPDAREQRHNDRNNYTAGYDDRADNVAAYDYRAVNYDADNNSTDNNAAFDHDTSSVKAN